MPLVNNDVEQAPLAGMRRSSRVPSTRFPLQTTDDDYELSTLEEEAIVSQNSMIDNRYTLATK